MAQRTRMTCKQAVEILGEYLEGTLGPEALADLERHFEDCAPCRAYLATYRKTCELADRAGRADMPAEMRERLRRFLLGSLQRP